MANEKIVNRENLKAFRQANDTRYKNGTVVVGKAQVADSLETELGKLDKTPFAFETSGGKTDIESGYQRTLKLVGANIVKNQYARPLNSTYWGFVNASGSISDNVSTFTATFQYGMCALKSDYRSTTLVANHKYLIMANIKTTSATADIRFTLFWNNLAGESFEITQSTTNWQTVSKIISFGSTTYNNGFIGIVDARSNGWDAIQVKNVILIDLTQMFGSNDVVNAIIGNDTSKQVQNLLNFLGGWLPTDYDTGTMLNSNSAKIKSVGYNQWDEEWEQGTVNSSTGEKQYASSQIRSKNYIRVVSGQLIAQYVESNVSEEKSIVFTFFDANYNIVPYVRVNQNDAPVYNNSADTNRNNTTAIVPQGAVWMLFRTSNSYGTTYKNNISIYYYWDGSRIGYEPYEEKIEDLPNIELNGILKVDGSGNIYADGDELYPSGDGNKRRYGSVDLGSLSWTYSNGFFKSSSLNDVIKGGEGNNDVPNVLCTIYGRSAWSGSGNMNIFVAPQSNTTETYRLQITNNSYSDAAAFKTAMSGVYLYYELVSPTDLTASTFTENLWADDFGTLQFLDSNNMQIVGLQGVEIFYKANVAGFAESLYDLAEGEPSNIALKSDLSTLVSQTDLSSGITDVAGLTYDIKKAYKTGNVVSVLVVAKNQTGNAISASTNLFTLSGFTALSANVAITGYVGDNVGRFVAYSGVDIQCDSAIPNNTKIYLNFTLCL